MRRSVYSCFLLFAIPCFPLNQSIFLIFYRAGTMFNLAPMGMGRASFRLAEIIQTGRIPIYLYGDYPWLPYHQTGFCPPFFSLFILSFRTMTQYIVQFYITSSYRTISCDIKSSYLISYHVLFSLMTPKVNTQSTT